MKVQSKVLLLLPVIVFCFSCQRKSEELNHIQLAEQYVSVSPEKAKAELDSIGNDFFHLSLKWRARYTYTSCLIADKMKIDMPSAENIKEAKDWYMKHGTALEKCNIFLFLGRAHRDSKEENEALNEYLNALNIAQLNQLTNESGFINSHIANLYEDKMNEYAALDKYKKAADYFLKAGNMRSYGYANRDIGRIYYYLDSSQLALAYMWKADSLAKALNDTKMMAATSNGIGNLYLEIGEYEKAETSLRQALLLDTNKISPNLMGLNELYITQKQYDKARLMLDTLYTPELSDNYKRNILYNYYLIHSGLQNTQKALEYFEQYYELLEKSLIEMADSNFIEMGKKYDQAILHTHIQQLTISRQWYMIAYVASTVVILLLIILYQYRRNKTNKQLFKKEQELKGMSIKILELSIQIDHESRILQSQSTTIQESKDKEIKLEKLRKELYDIRTKKMDQSLLRKKLFEGGQLNKSGVRVLIDDILWAAIEEEIASIYPNFFQSLFDKHPNLTKQDYQYCCLSLFHLGTDRESTLLNVNSNSIRKRRTRIREAMGVSFINSDISSDLYTYLINEVLKD